MSSLLRDILVRQQETLQGILLTGEHLLKAINESREVGEIMSDSDRRTELFDVLEQRPLPDTLTIEDVVIGEVYVQERRDAVLVKELILQVLKQNNLLQEKMSGIASDTLAKLNAASQASKFAREYHIGRPEIRGRLVDESK